MSNIMKRYASGSETCDECDCPIRKGEPMWATREGERWHYACKFPDAPPAAPKPPAEETWDMSGYESVPSSEEVERMRAALAFYADPEWRPFDRPTAGRSTVPPLQGEGASDV